MRYVVIVKWQISKVGCIRRINEIVVYNYVAFYSTSIRVVYAGMKLVKNTISIQFTSIFMSMCIVFVFRFTDENV